VRFTGYLSKWPALLRFREIPLQNILLAGSTAEIRGALSAATQSSDDNDLGGLAIVGFDGGLEGRLHVLKKRGRVLELGDRALGVFGCKIWKAQL